MEFNSSLPLSDSINLIAWSMSLKRKGRSKMPSLGVYDPNFERDGASNWTSPRSSASSSLLSPKSVELGYTSTHISPFSSWFTLSARLFEATTFGWVVPPVTWLSLTTTSPLSHSANAETADTQRAKAEKIATTALNFSFVIMLISCFFLGGG